MNLTSLPAFAADGALHVVVESPRGATVKLKYDAVMEACTLSRPLIEGLVYPCDWGFVPSTCAADGDPLDAIVMWDRATFPGVVLRCRPLGILGVEQNSKRKPGHRERNDRLVVLPLEAPRLASLTTVDDLPDRVKREIEAFFLASTAFEKKDLSFIGWFGPEEARELVTASASEHQKPAASIL